MTPEEFNAKYPLIEAWIRNLLESQSANARPVASLGFKRLPSYFSGQFLAASKVIIAATVPVPPLSKLGLSEFSGFESWPREGITYLDSYFVRTDCAGRESLHLHELIHVVQWSLLGPKRFLAEYAEGLARFGTSPQGYRKMPLEEMAYDAQDAFEHSLASFNAESLVAAKLGALHLV